MAYFRCGGSGIPASLKSGMNSVLNKKFGTSTTYDPADWPADVNLLGPLPVKSASGAIASFSDGADGVPVKSCSVSFLPSGGGGTPSAPVAIQGVSGLSVTQLGKNLMSASPVLTDNRYICYWGNHSASGANDGVFLKAGTYTITFTKPSSMETANFGVYGAYTEDKTQITIIGNTRNNPLSNQITVPKDGHLNFWIYGTANEITSSDVPLITCQIEVGSTATTYEAYVTPSVVTDTFGQTIYGGTRDLTTDKASVTWGYHKVTSSDGIYAYATGNGFRVSTNTSTWTDGIMKGQTNCGGVCNAFVKVTDNNSTGIRFSIGDNTSIYFVNVYDVVGSTVENFKSYLDNHDIYVAYELSNPTEITGLTPHEIDTLYGDNNIYADTGTTSVEYRADIDLTLNA